MEQNSLVRVNTAIAPSDLGGIADRLLLQLPMFLTAAFGLIFMVGRFIAVLKEDLKEPPDNLASVALLAVLVAAAAVMVTLACTAVGAIIGLVLRACFGKRLHRVLSRHFSFSEASRLSGSEPLAKRGFSVPRLRPIGRQEGGSNS